MRLSVPYGRPHAGRSARWPSSSRSSSIDGVVPHATLLRAGTGGSRVAEATKPPRLREWAPTITLSSTDSAGEQRQVLERAGDPELGDAVAGQAQQVLAGERDAALGRRYRRLTTLKNVVLPAPFGPMSAQI